MSLFKKKHVVMIAAVIGLHAFLIYYFRNVFKWYWVNTLANPYYDFALIFVALWMGLYLFVYKKKTFKRMNLFLVIATLAVLWVVYAVWKGKYFAAVCFMTSSVFCISFVWHKIAGYVDSFYTAVFFTLPFPFYTEVLSFMQIITLKASLLVTGLIGLGLKSRGASVFFYDGEIQIAAACSGFQSAVVLFYILAFGALGVESIWLRKRFSR